MASFLSDIELLEPLGKSFNQKGALKDWSGGPIKPETPMEPKTIKARPTPKVQAPQAAPAPDTSSMALDKTRRETFGQIAKRVGGRKAALQLLTRAASKLIPAAGAADIGYTIGTMLDQATGASDKISDLLAFGQVRDRDDSGAANVQPPPPTTSKASQRITQEVFDSLPSQIEQGLDQELSQFKGYSPFNR